MQSWIEFVPVLAVALGVVLVPGALIGWVAGARGAMLLGLAAPLTYAVLGASAIVGPVLGLSWGWLTVLPGLLAAALVAFGVRRLVGDRPTRESDGTIWTALPGLVLGGVLACVLVGLVVVTPDAFADRFDNVFHLNAVRHVVDTQNASPFHVGTVSMPESPGFYPAVWYALASLVAGWTGVAVPTAVTATNMAVVAGAWVAGAVFLAHVLVPESRRLAGLVAGVLATLLPGFPLLFLEWGTIYPNLAGFAPLLTVLAMVLLALDPDSFVRTSASRLWLVIVGVIAVGGVALAHPNALLVVVLFVATASLVAAVRATGSGRSLPRAAAVAAGVLVLGAVVWFFVRPSLAAAPWFPYLTPGQAVGEALTGGYLGRPVPWLILAAVVTGAFVAVRTRRVTVLALWLVTVSLFAVSAGMHRLGLRELLVGGFYADNFRVAAVAAVGALPLAIIGGTAVTSWCLAAVTGTRPGGRSPRALVGVAVTVVVTAILALVLVASGGALRFGIDVARTAYQLEPYNELLDPDELQLIEDLPQLVDDEDAVLLGRAGRGTAFAYALTGYTVGAAHMFWEPTEPVAVLDEQLNEALPGTRAQDEVCSAIDDIGAPVYVLDFDRSNYAPPRDVPLDEDQQPGLNDLDEPVVEVVSQVGEARLLRVTACDA